VRPKWEVTPGNPLNTFGVKGKLLFRLKTCGGQTPLFPNSSEKDLSGANKNWAF